MVHMLAIHEYPAFATTSIVDLLDTEGEFYSQVYVSGLSICFPLGGRPKI